MTEMIQIPDRDYSLGKTVVTQLQWREVMGTEPWKGRPYVMEGDDYPAVYVSWDDAVEFCKKLTDIEGKAYRLPTEAEWEYACRAGTTTSYHFGDDATELGKYAWFCANARDIDENYPHRVEQKLPNQFGLYDMHGNVWEWCSDLYDEDDEEQQDRALRGGSWFNDSVICSARYRNYSSPEYRDINFGLRLASTI
jgi:formylglycine-generating enzyme required for sulfatase activity